MRASRTLVVVFAKAPHAGKVKTRLAAAIGADEAARLHARLVRHAVATAVAADCGPVELHGAPPGNAFLRTLARRYGLRVRGQADGDVGRRMFQAFRRGLRAHSRMILIGSDCPALTAADLRLAARLLRSADAVIVPAEDGGYPLLGLARNSPAVFKGVPWSTAKVMSETRQRFAALGWRWRELRMLWDIDRPADLLRLRSERLLARRP